MPPGVLSGARLVSCLFQVTEADLGIDYEIEKLTAGEDAYVPVPGLSLDVPVLGSAGVNLVARITGSVQELTLSFGLDACGSVLGVETCGADVDPYRLPVMMLNETYAFGSVCAGRVAVA
mmetsp:Transcript_22527/g.72913  ORF Transcript_22527/g.72913 Transcript_22527/m.72913 type:complete len:120 (-) Transcript_22527:27-386(-)